MSPKVKKVSKKNKTAWRKYTKVADVEQFLEEKRQDERLGPALTTVPDKDLFVIESKPCNELLSSKERRKLKAAQPPKCFSVLQTHSKVPDPIAKRNRVRTKEERRNNLVKRKEEQRLAKGLLKAKDIQSLSDRRLDELRRNKQPKRGEFSLDAWNEEPKTTIEKIEWINDTAKKQNLKYFKTLTLQAKREARSKVSGIPAVEIPHPGTSYNPSFVDHQNLLKSIAEKEKEQIKVEEHLNRVTKPIFSSRVSEEQRDEMWKVEMSEGLVSQEGASFEETEENDAGHISRAVKNKKKTLQQRRRQKEHEKLEKERQALKLEKKKITDIHRLKALQKQIEALEAKQETLREKRERVKELKKNEPKRLCVSKFEDNEIDFNMMNEIAGNLRNIIKGRSLLKDRFKSLQKRSILEPKSRAHHKKGKVKKFIKPGHRVENFSKTVAHSLYDKKE